MSRAPIISGDQIIREAEDERHGCQEDHSGPVHCEKLVEVLRTNQMIVRYSQLKPESTSPPPRRPPGNTVRTECTMMPSFL